MDIWCNSKFLFENTANNYEKCLHEDKEIEERRVMLDIVSIIGNLIFERVLLSPIDLCHACDARFDR